MRNNEESHSVLKDYFGFDAHGLLIFLGLVVGVIAVVTLIYVAIFGYQSWSTNMEQAGSLLLTNSAAPASPQATATDQQAALGCPPGTVPAGAQLRCPTCNTMSVPQWGGSNAQTIATRP